MPEPTPTRRMKWIIQKMTKHGAYIQEHRDAFREKSWYELTWNESDRRNCSAIVTRKMLNQLTKAGLIRRTEHNPVYQHGKFITSESVYALNQKENSHDHT
jgi:hypothetical protein